MPGPKRADEMAVGPPKRVSATDELLTLRDWLRYAVSRFRAGGLTFGHGCHDAYDEAAYLILHTLALPLDRLEPFLDARLTAAERRALAAVLRRRVDERVPAAYITGEAWLGDFRFQVDPRVVVPRSFIAGLLDGGLDPWIRDPDKVQSALDLCTGSGCLAILLAHHYPVADVDAADISPDALAVAQRNVADYDLQARINLVRSNVFDNLAAKVYDLIVCNPPYVTATAMAELPPEYRHEPSLALAGGIDGMDVVRRLLAEAALHLAPDGVLVVEVGHNRDIVEAAFPSLAFTWLSTEGADDAVFLLTRAELSARAGR
jgi:ribosomal protein L3 glutamine methyltransferase